MTYTFDIVHILLCRIALRSPIEGWYVDVKLTRMVHYFCPVCILYSLGCEDFAPQCILLFGAEFSESSSSVALREHFRCLLSFHIVKEDCSNIAYGANCGKISLNR